SEVVAEFARIQLGKVTPPAWNSGEFRYISRLSFSWLRCRQRIPPKNICDCKKTKARVLGHVDPIASPLDAVVVRSLRALQIDGRHRQVILRRRIQADKTLGVCSPNARAKRAVGG